jgi:PAS domain S-box-containing protein
MTETEKIPVLLVDDRPENLAALEVLLEGLGLDCVKALSGNEALRLSLKHDFALVLMDVKMPDMDGFETAELMRANKKTRHLPIIFITAALDDANYQFKGYEAGAVDYLAKPIEPTIMLSKVRVFCDLYRQRRQIELREQHLEAIIKERTAELRYSNELLQKELTERKEAEENLHQQTVMLEQEIAERQEAQEALGEEILERKRADAEARHLKNYLANIIDSMPSMLVGLDRDGGVTQWNRRAEEATGIPATEAVGRPLGELTPDFTPWIDQLRTETANCCPASMEKLLIEKRGERRFYDLMLYPLVTNGVEGTVVRIEDVTERARIQELMIQTEKMMSVGGLAAGMAHEINNPLGIITQAAQNIERRVSPDLPANQEAAAESGVNLDGLNAYFERRQIPEFIASIREAAGRASRIIANMLHFSRRTETIMQPASLAAVMEQAMELAASDYDLKKKYDFRGIEIVREYQPDLPDIPLVATEMEQVFLNMLKNAAQAMTANPPERRPRIVLRLKQEERYAVLEVEDNGPGMTEEVRHRVFEPFFTTKEPGIGTGLGLSVSYMIVTQNHKGLMEVVSTPGNGARFTIRLPLEEHM